MAKNVLSQVAYVDIQKPKWLISRGDALKDHQTIFPSRGIRFRVAVAHASKSSQWTLWFSERETCLQGL